MSLAGQERGRTWGRDRGGCFEGKRTTQRWAVGRCWPDRPGDLVQLDELRDGVTLLNGDLHHVPRGRHGPAGAGHLYLPPCNFRPRAHWVWAPGDEGAPLSRGLKPVARTHGPGAHSGPGAGFPEGARQVPGWSPGVGGRRLARPAPQRRPRPAPRCGRWSRAGGRAAAPPHLPSSKATHPVPPPIQPSQGEAPPKKTDQR